MNREARTAPAPPSAALSAVAFHAFVIEETLGATVLTHADVPAFCPATSAASAHASARRRREAVLCGSSEGGLGLADARKGLGDPACGRPPGGNLGLEGCCPRTGPRRAPGGGAQSSRQGRRRGRTRSAGLGRRSQAFTGNRAEPGAVTGVGTCHPLAPVEERRAYAEGGNRWGDSTGG